MYWKQPITTEVLQLDPVTEIIITRILLRARNEDMKYPAYFVHGNQNVQYQLKRGQAIFIMQDLIAVGIPRRKIEESIKILEGQNCTFTLEGLEATQAQNCTFTCTFTRKPFGFIVSVLNYDSLTKFDDFVQSPVQSLVHSPVHTNNKSDIERQERNKNVEEVLPAKTEKTISSKKDILENELYLYHQETKFPLLNEKEINLCLDLAIQTAKRKNETFYYNNALNWLEKENTNKSKQTKQSKDPNLLTF